LLPWEQGNADCFLVAIPHLPRGHDECLSIGQDGRSRYVGSTFWANSGIITQDIDLQHYLHDEDGPPVNFSQQRVLTGFSPFDFNDPKIGNSVIRQWVQSNGGNLYKCRFCGHRYTISCVLSTLPPKSACDVLLKSFFTTVYPVIPVLHLPTFSDEYQSFWFENESRDWHASMPGRTIANNPSIVCLLFSILFAGSMTVSGSRLAELSAEREPILPGDLYFGTMVSMALVGFPRRPTLYSLAAFLFAQNQLTREEEFLDSPSFISTAFRIALGMGLHRDGSVFGLPEVEIEMRRGLWWHIVHTDVMASSSSGLPPLFFDEKMSNTAMISQQEDTRNIGADGLPVEQRGEFYSSRWQMSVC
jgi:Fungal specific transcription factor domain